MSPTERAAKAIEAFNIQRVKTQKEVTEKYKMENAIMRGDYLKRTEIDKRLATVADGVVSKIMASDISRQAKEQLLNDIASIPLTFEEIAHGQSRLAAAKAKKAATEKDKKDAKDSEAGGEAA